MKYFNVKPLFLIAVPRPLSNINFLSCSICGSRLSWLLQSPTDKVEVANFFRRRTQARLSLSECFFSFQVFVGFFIFISGYPDLPSFCGPRPLEEEHSRQAKEKSLDRNNVKTFYKLFLSQIYVSIAVGWFWQINSAPKYIKKKLNWGWVKLH